MKLLLTTFCLFMMIGCATQKPLILTTPSAQSAENRLMTDAISYEQHLMQSEVILQNPALTQYILTLMTQLFPAEHQNMNVTIIDAPGNNAFTLPNGRIYIHTGLLSRLRNESQLATILAHEGAHFVEKHGLKQRLNARAKANTPKGFSLLNFEFYQAVVFESAASGFSRAMEAEADSIACERMRLASYDIDEAKALFEQLLAEAKYSSAKRYFFSSHPSLQERIDAFEQAQGNTSVLSKPDSNVFMDITNDARERGLVADIRNGRVDAVIDLLNDNAMRSSFKHGDYYLAEAYRRKGTSTDLTAAHSAYQQQFEKTPDHALSVLGFANTLYLQGKLTQASKQYKQYIELAPNELFSKLALQKTKVMER